MDGPSEHLPEQAPVSMPVRRSFLAVALTATGGLVSAALDIPLVRSIAFPLRDSAEAVSWSDVGKVGEFRPLKEPVARMIVLIPQAEVECRGKVEGGCRLRPPALRNAGIGEPETYSH